jgi:type IV pilus assembly protein PilQ
MNLGLMKISKWARAFLLFGAMLSFSNCAPGNMPAERSEKEAPSTTTRSMISDIIVKEDASSVNVLVETNGRVSSTARKQTAPLGVILYLPKTGIDQTRTLSLPESEILDSVTALQGTVTGEATRIEILLKKDTEYEVRQQGTNLTITFLKVKTEEDISEPEPIAMQRGMEATPMQLGDETSESEFPATEMDLVTANKLQNGVEIKIRADGRIKDYKTFTVKSPPRIVYELYNLKSPYQTEQTVPVNTKWVRRVRFYGYPDRVTVVLDTNHQFLEKFQAMPANDGLLIQVGDDIQTKDIQPKVENLETSPKPEMLKTEKAISDESANKINEDNSSDKQEITTEGSAAWINRIDFSSEKNGKSTIIVGTTRPVKYDLKEAKTGGLRLRLYNTMLPDYRKRPLITTRFESAVDRITPVQTAAMGKIAAIAIEMREAVAHSIDQKDNLLMINFEPSAIPPKPFEEAKLPAWKKIVAQTAAESKLDMNMQDGEEGLSEGRPEKYVGEKIALDFYETDIKNVFRILREISKKNFAIDDDVNGKVTLTLKKPVPWDQVLELILKMNNLGMVHEGDIIRIATLAKLKLEETTRRSTLKEAQQDQAEMKELEPMITEYIPVNYAKAQELQAHIEKMLTKERGSVSVDNRTQTIIVEDVPDKIKQVKRIINQLDKVTPQVIINAKVVEVTSNAAKSLGVHLNAIGGISDETIAAGGVGQKGIGPQRGFDALNGTWGYNFATNLPAVAGRSLNLSFIKIAGTPLLLDMDIYAQESLSEAKIISAPRILTLDNEPAMIKQGFEVPYTTVDKNGNPTTNFKQVDLLLEVTPHVTPDSRIALEVKLTKNDIGELTAGEAPAITTKEVDTKLLLNDGDTIVIGGIKKSNALLSNTGLPGLVKIPILKWLFGTEQKSKTMEELLIFLTPKIVTLQQREVEN